MPALYHPSIYDTRHPVASYWEETAGPAVEGAAPLARDAACDVAIIGGGYTGLSAAYHLARDHGIAARVLEAGPPGWGASGRNGGFCGPSGAKMSVAEMSARFGVEETRRYFQTGREAVDLVRALGDEEKIDFDARGDGEFAVAHSPRAATHLADYAAAMSRVYDLPCQALSREAFAERGYRGPECFGAMFQPVGFGLHPLKLARGLARAAMRRGAVIHGETPVIHWEKTGAEHRLVTPGSTLRAKRVIVGTNGYTRDGLHPGLDGVLLPALSNIVVTRPLTADERAAHGWATDNPIWDNRHLFYYFRMLPDGRFLIGARGNTTARPADEARMQARLAADLGRLWPAWREVPITHSWRGFVCLSRSLAPNVGVMDDDPTVAYAVGYHGSGVAWANWSGRAVARLLVGNARVSELLPAVLRQPLKRFPFPAFRVWYLRAAYAMYGIKDRLGR
ncbi:MAG: FAD-dependent oxidoreductase [Alphaproteobacteria bacterium]